MISSEQLFIILRYNCIGYNIDVMRRSSCLVANPITVYRFVSLFTCTPIGRAFDWLMDTT